MFLIVLQELIKIYIHIHARPANIPVMNVLTFQQIVSSAYQQLLILSIFIIVVVIVHAQVLLSDQALNVLSVIPLLTVLLALDLLSVVVHA